MKRSSGVLLAISSLPSEFGIGGFSHDAESFITSILDMGFHWWQILPLCPIGYGNSPYSGISSYAGSYLYIDPIRLAEEGLISYDIVDMVKYYGDSHITNYEHAKWAKRTVIEHAFMNLNEEWKSKIADFAKKEEKWLDDYALFMAISEQKNVPFQQWEKELKYRQKTAIKEAKRKLKLRIDYYIFEQFLFFWQWNKIKSFANSVGVGIIGDMPIYVAEDSVDVWANPESYLLDKQLNPTVTSGLPADYFSKEGHNWGNPIYNYDYMKENNYSYWVDKIGHSLKMYDCLRLDHFRGFFEYWAIPKDATPNEGKWCKGPGLELFKIINKKYKNAEIIGEDLGIIEDKVRSQMKKSGYPGMRVMLFGFYEEESTNIPHNYSTDCVAYTATHDNNTILGWLYVQEEGVREYALKYCGMEGAGWGRGGPECISCKAFIKTLISSSAKLVIVPIQDMCGFGSDTRMNTPGTTEGNWVFRLTYSTLNSINNYYFRECNELYGRNRGYKG